MAKSKKIEPQELPNDAPLGAGVEEMTIAGNEVGGTEDLNALLGNLESELTATAKVNGPIPPQVADNLMDDLALLDETLNSDSDQLPLDDSRKPVAEGNDDAGTDATPAPAAPAAKGAATQTKRINTAGMTKSEALVKALGARANEFLIINVSDADLKPAQQASKIAALLEEIDNNTPIKIQEKVVNLYAHIANGANLSNYTATAIHLLVKDGELTSKSLKDAYLAHPYAEGTASSQTTQMMKLLPMLGLAIRSGSKLTVNDDSMLLPILAAK